MSPKNTGKSSSPSLPKFPRANKKLGQHFLHSQKIVELICRDFTEKAEVVVEVGPGPGTLTSQLRHFPGPFYVVEKDTRFQSNLQALLQENQIHWSDALEVSWSSFLSEHNLQGKKTWLVSNLPYNVGVPLLINFLQCEDIQFLTLMFQKEVATKILGESGERERKKDMGSLAALTQNYFSVRELCQVSPAHFTPPPKVHSMVISLERKKNPVIGLPEFKIFEQFLRALFQFKRKIITKGLLTLFPKEKIVEALNLCHISPQARAETLSLENVQQLYQAIKSNE